MTYADAVQTKAHSNNSAANPAGKAPFFAPVIQAKLTVNTPGDQYEQEADHVADQVMRMKTGDTPIVQRMPLTSMSGVMRKCAACEKEEQEGGIHRKETGGQGGQAAPPIVNSVLSSGGGHSLDAGTKGFMESRFGQDFSQVRIHTDARAAESAQAIQAKAYTSGRDIVFGSGEYQPGSEGGKRLLAHELVHVGQQTSASGKKIARSNSSFELSPVAGQPIIQRDLAIQPPRPAAVGRVLTPAQMTNAITFNNQVLGSIANSADIIEMIRDVIGISKLPAVVDADFVNGVVQWQANFGLTQDGQLGPRTARPLFREIGAEGVGRGQVRRAPRYTPTGPINVARGGARGAHFDMSAEFNSDPKNGIFPSCCEVRQEIQWDAAFVAASVAAGNGTVPHAGFPAAHPAGRWIEDRNDTNTLRYGHRSFFGGGAGNRYLDTSGRQNQAFGHIFEGQDNPMGLAADRGSWRFRLAVYDVCNNNTLLQQSPVLVLNWL